VKYRRLLLIIFSVLIFGLLVWIIQDITARQSLTISGITIPHHELVKNQRETFLAKVSKVIKQPSTIILVSPNHYNVGISNIQTSRQVWKVAGGSIQPNIKVIESLSSTANEEPGSFANEHGIKYVLGDIQHYFPSSKIVPIILKQGTTMQQIDSLNNALVKNCTDKCLMVDSVDFSHYQPALLANFHDDLTIRALQNLDTTTLFNKSEVDSPAALALLSKWASTHHTDEFHLDNHTNSGILDNDPDMESTSHVYGWYQTGNAINPPKSVSFTIGGDMMFGRSISHKFLADGLETSLDQLGDRVFWGTDAGIINLEGPINSVPAPDNIDPNNLTFDFPPQTIQALQYIHINAVSQANNHSDDAGQSGLATTRLLLQKADIQPFGGPTDGDTISTAVFSGEKFNLYVIGVNELSSQPDLTKQIQALKKNPNNKVMIFPHWGTEYINTHTILQQQQAHAWIDAGADIVIGSHPHVIEDSELYKGHPIIYSLGNLLFDQDFSKTTQQGLIIVGKFQDDGLYLFGLPVQSKDYKPALITGNTKNTILKQLYTPLQADLHKSNAGNYLFFPM
jgi:poly-gamma-glutamate synthesis protein (capsule biosynthesis protein)